MESDKARDRRSQRDEHRGADSARTSGRKPQRKLLQQQMESSGSASACAHGEDSQFDSHFNPPQHDRAG